VSFYKFVIPGFFQVDSFDKANSQFAGFGFFGRFALGYQLLRWILSVLVCPVRAFMNVSISNINEQVEILFSFVPDGVLDFQECGVFVVSGFQLFVIGKIPNIALGSFGISEHCRSQGRPFLTFDPCAQSTSCLLVI
jgi:hypothetical protein